MKTNIWSIIFVIWFGLIFSGELLAQTATERQFIKTCNEQLSQLSRLVAARNYAGGEAICRQMISRYDSLAHRLTDGFVYYKYNGYYNLASLQALQGKRAEAISSLTQALADGKYEISYRQVLADSTLSCILGDKALQPVLAGLKARTDYLQILRDAPDYAISPAADKCVRVEYATPDDEGLKRVRQYFGLDSLVVPHDEVATIKRILTFVHNRIRHDGLNGLPEGDANAVSFDEACKDGRRGLNCRGLATVLNECNLAMGIPSRVVTCLPKVYVSDCHVINAVYSQTLGKWLWMAPTNNAWVTDEQGHLLSIQEVRERLRSGQPLRLNKEANWNNRTPVKAERYLYDYMAKNLYFLECWSRYGFNTECSRSLHYILLSPVGCRISLCKAEEMNVNDDTDFWQAPQ